MLRRMTDYLESGRREDFGRGEERGGSRVAEMIEGDRVRQSTESEVFNGGKHLSYIHKIPDNNNSKI